MMPSFATKAHKVETFVMQRDDTGQGRDNGEDMGKQASR
jgi:hypothetical protein